MSRPEWKTYSAAVRFSGTNFPEALNVAQLIEGDISKDRGLLESIVYKLAGNLPLSPEEQDYLDGLAASVGLRD